MVSPITTSELCLPVKPISMEGGMLGGSIMSAASTGRLELNRPFHDTLGGFHYIGQTVPHNLHGAAPWRNNQCLNDHQAINVNSIDHQGNIQSGFLLSKAKSSGTSDEDESSWKEVTDEHHCEKGKRTSPWQRIKWTDDMIKLLINIVNIVGEDASVDNLDINKRSILQKKGKWRSVSNIMNQKGWYVSPQQCEDKFNDLNKRYKRLTDILGRDTALQVVNDINLLDSITNLSAKRKDDVKKILSSKHSFYKEMHSYHSGFKSSMVVDLRTQSSKVSAEGDAGIGDAKSVQAENMGGLKRDVRKSSFMENPHVDSSMDGVDVDRGPSLLCQTERGSKFLDGKHGLFYSNDSKEATICSNFPCSMQDDSKATAGSDLPCGMQDESSTAQEMNILRQRLMHLEELKVGLQAQALELERQRHKWQKLNCKKNDELERLREENKRMKLENNQLTYQLKQKELEVECKRSVTSMALFDLVLERLRAKEQADSMQGRYG